MLENEADACRKYVLPKVYDVAWADDQIREQRTLTGGRIVVVNAKCCQRKPNSQITS
jgi:type I restriction enzyme, R subunit